ncbi:acetyltransferase (GNAT) family protein [Chitinophaga niastensis]|uniref:Acetyltransferase (GNAT) family protein n=1 Tax=Chitinophaga niastensis TaxID=536980 RepID=A0A2P8HEV7_CHINA|nr:GNAT family N-acetyltransferase [Chitinophaga niastensis]PSL44731.1 acetyltransferase (GNAT) family protein [Chitinophaga niastensis]
MIQREKDIINNLFEFWNFVGNSSKTILVAPDFKAINLHDSDWPKRIFDLGKRADPENSIFKQLSSQIAQRSLPNSLTLTESVSFRHKDHISEAGFFPRLKQLGMIINLSEADLLDDTAGFTFKAVRNAADTDLYASIASQSFQYRVDPRILESLLNNDNRVKLFICFYDDAAAGCGLIFYDENEYAGLHMIGTLPQFRGKGVASYMTTHLMKECIKDGKMHCVLHASAAGEKVYVKLGFTPVKQIVTYSLQLDGQPS